MDGQAAIFEADFGDNEVTIAGIKNRLANIFDIDPATISHTITQTAYGPVVTYNRNGDRLRMIQFGGVDPTWEESRQAVIAYLIANGAAWGEGEEIQPQALAAPEVTETTSRNVWGYILAASAGAAVGVAIASALGFI
jgi:hypothetical protein